MGVTHSGPVGLWQEEKGRIAYPKTGRRCVALRSATRRLSRAGLGPSLGCCGVSKLQARSGEPAWEDRL